jgi:hypothetical protein
VAPKIVGIKGVVARGEVLDDVLIPAAVLAEAVHDRQNAKGLPLRAPGLRIEVETADPREMAFLVIHDGVLFAGVRVGLLEVREGIPCEGVPTGRVSRGEHRNGVDTFAPWW